MLSSRMGERTATALMVLGALYVLGHVIAAWLRGSFAAVTR